MKMRIKTLITAAVVCLLGVNSVGLAYIVSTMNPAGVTRGAAIDYRRTTHLVVVGHGDLNKATKKITNLFLPASVSRAFRYRELFPQNQIVFLTTRENKSELDRTHLKRWGLQIQSESEEPLSGENTLRIADRFSSIASIDFYGHSSVMWGIGLESDVDRVTMKLDGLSRIKDNFRRPGSFVSINGCNSGFYLAPTLAAIWNVPVMGSFTGTDYQQLHQNGTWYFNNPGQYPPPKAEAVVETAPGVEAPPSKPVQIWAKENLNSYDHPVACSGAHGCVRMKPSLGGYYGMWSPPTGFSAGLNIYKFFCPGYTDGMRAGPAYENCMNGIAQAFITFPSVNPIRYDSPKGLVQENLMDYLCPSASSRSTRPSASLRSNNSPDFQPIAPETPVDARDRCVKAILDSERNGSLVYDAEWKSKSTIECTTSIRPETDPYAGIYGLVGGLAYRESGGGFFSFKPKTKTLYVQSPVYRGCEFKFGCETARDVNGRETLVKNTCDVTTDGDQSRPQTFLSEYQLILESMRYMRGKYYNLYNW